MKDTEQQKKWGSWELFVIALGFLVIVTAPMYDKPIMIVIEGLTIVLIGVLMMRVSRKNQELKNRKMRQKPKNYKPKYQPKKK
ncbi:hypothetical protein AAK706_07640 [Erysipelotrichaceae bacterium 66-17]|nr:hypothetical protein [Erysipelotrichaceae bacterium]